jgi:hypothetical protein
MEPKNTCSRVVHRLVEIRVGAGYRSVSDVDEMIACIGECVRSLPATDHAIIAADWRGVRTMSPETAERARAMFKGANPRVLRSAILVPPDGATTHLQASRLVREAENSSRRLFTDVPSLRAWLGEVLTESERARLAEFLPE